ncbi:hypothetical protein MPH_08121 [Macrophomina phaseolina MS6]|uniref:Uncharacterized protein n=1 Tax=Macrophomina phaseolina (strain MS6) TaxID=1126212 RepID=K2RJ35_MACPH|nr:hypothetical protein MPH_08121 [Macrophomina phaseolina MS6]
MKGIRALRPLHSFSSDSVGNSQQQISDEITGKAHRWHVVIAALATSLPYAKADWLFTETQVNNSPRLLSRVVSGIGRQDGSANSASPFCVPILGRSTRGNFGPTEQDRESS